MKIKSTSMEKTFKNCVNCVLSIDFWSGPVKLVRKLSASVEIHENNHF